MTSDAERYRLGSYNLNHLATGSALGLAEAYGEDTNSLWGKNFAVWHKMNFTSVTRQWTNISQ